MIKYGIVTVPKAYLYADDLEEISDEVLMGWAVLVTLQQKEKNGIMYCRVVTHYGYEGYMRADLIRETDENELRNRDNDTDIFVINRSFADLLSQPRVQGNILLTLSRGSFVKVLKFEENGYCLVSVEDGTTGYIPSVALIKRLDNDGYLYSQDKNNYFLKQCILGTINEESFRDKVTITAKSYLGTQYRWGGKSAAGIDCSGLTFMIYMIN